MAPEPADETDCVARRSRPARLWTDGKTKLGPHNPDALDAFLRACVDEDVFMEAVLVAPFFNDGVERPFEPTYEPFGDDDDERFVTAIGAICHWVASDDVGLPSLIASKLDILLQLQERGAPLYLNSRGSGSERAFDSVVRYSMIGCPLYEYYWGGLAREHGEKGMLMACDQKASLCFQAAVPMMVADRDAYHCRRSQQQWVILRLLSSLIKGLGYRTLPLEVAQTIASQAVVVRPSLRLLRDTAKRLYEGDYWDNSIGGLHARREHQTRVDLGIAALTHQFLPVILENNAIDLTIEARPPKKRRTRWGPYVKPTGAKPS